MSASTGDKLSPLIALAKLAGAAVSIDHTLLKQWQVIFTVNALQAFADLIREDEREQCALVDPMDEVAHRFAHPLALELECVLADRNANWDRAMNLIDEYRSAMNAIHEQHSPTFMGEPSIRARGTPAAQGAKA